MEYVRLILSLIAAPFKRLGYNIRKIFLKIFPKRAAKYFDADLHELKYIGLMAVYALAINLYIETFARLTTSPVAGILWAIHSPLAFLYNAIIIFATMTLALLFKRRRFAWMMISLIWIICGSVNGVVLLSRITPFTLYDLGNLADGLTIINNYYTKWQIIMIAVGFASAALAIVFVYLRSDKWQNVRYGKSITAVVLAAAFAFGSTYGAIKTDIVSTYFGNLNYAFRDYGFAYGFIATSASAGISKPHGYSE